LKHILLRAFYRIPIQSRRTSNWQESGPREKEREKEKKGEKEKTMQERKKEKRLEQRD